MMTLGNMRQNGVAASDVTWLHCGHQTAVNVDACPDDGARNAAGLARRPSRTRSRGGTTCPVAGLQVSPLLGLFPSFAFQFDGGTSFALRRTSIYCPHDQVLSRSRKAMLPGGSPAQPTLTVSRWNHPGLPRTTAFLFLATSVVVSPQSRSGSLFLATSVVVSPQSRSRSAS